MKIAGKVISGPNKATIVIPRGNTPEEHLIFQAQAVLDFTEFDALVTRPKPSVKILRGGRREIDTNAPGYQDSLQDYATKRVSWIVLKSLEATPDLEWDIVDMGKPETWEKFEDELRNSGFSAPEIRRLIDECMAVNSLDDEKLDKARADFLAFQQQVEGEKLSSQKADPVSSPSGDAASDSV